MKFISSAKVLMILLFSLIFISSDNLASINASEEVFSAYDYLFFEPGHYNQFRVNDNGLTNGVIELVFQEGPSSIYSISITQIGTSGGYWRNSHITCGERDGKIIAWGGIPVGNQANFLSFIHNLPISFNDGSSWTDSNRYISFSAEYIDSYSIGTDQYEDCIRITFDSTAHHSSYQRGTGEYILAKNVGIVEFTFDKNDDNDFYASLIEYGELTPVTVSGSYILENSIPAEGYYVGISNAILESGKHGSPVDENGEYSFQIHGHSIVLRYGPLTDDLDTLYIDYSNQKKIDNIDGDVTAHLTSPDPSTIPPEIIVWPENVNVNDSFIVINGESADFDGIFNVTVNGEAATGWFHLNSLYWQKRVNLTIGYNVVTIVTYDSSESHNSAIKEIIVNYQIENYQGPTIEVVPLDVLPYNRQVLTYIVYPNGQGTGAYLNWGEPDFDNTPFNHGRAQGDYAGTEGIVVTHEFDRTLGLNEEILYRIHVENSKGWDSHEIVTLKVGYPDSTPPTILSVHPSPDDTGVSLTQPIVLNFDEQLDISTINENAFTVNGEEFKGTLQYDMEKYALELILQDPLQYSKLYLIEVSPSITDYAGNNLTNYNWEFHTLGPTIDVSKVSKVRCDLNEPSIVEFHVGWGNGTDISQGTIYVNGTGYALNSTGWVSFVATSSTIGERIWLITDVYCYGLTDFMMISENPSVVWDSIEIIIETPQRSDITSDSVDWLGRYLYNDENFEGSLVFNDTLSKSQVGSFSYEVMGVIDTKYGLGTVSANDFEVIKDRVALYVSLANNRIDVTDEPEITVAGLYEYDNQYFSGSVTLVQPLSQVVVGEYPILVKSIGEPLYGLSSFTQNEVSCIWDQVIVELSLSDDRIDVGEEPDVSYTAYYEFDTQPFIGDLSLTTPDSIEEISDFSYSVEGIEDAQYGLSTFVSEEVMCIWDRVKITEGGVSNEETNVKAAETVWFKAEYEYDSDSFDSSDGLLYLNNEPMEWSSSNQRWEKEYSSDSPETMTFQITGISDDTHGLTAFNNVAGPLSIEWKQAGIPGFPHQSILIGLVMVILMLYKFRK